MECVPPDIGYTVRNLYEGDILTIFEGFFSDLGYTIWDDQVTLIILVATKDGQAAFTNC